MSSLIGKSRKPKFELHLKFFDLNNIPLVSGHSFIKWHLAHSMHAEHRGRTAKCPISNHKVHYGYYKIVPSVRVSLDRHDCLADCPLELEVIQEFPAAEKITLGHIRLNLSEYVDESDGPPSKDTTPNARRANSSSIGNGNNNTSSNSKGRPSSSASAAGTAGKHETPRVEFPDHGIVRRYLMQKSKVNSTLKIGICMIQIDGERNFVAPPLKTAPVFGGIASSMGPEQAEDEIGPLPSVSKGRDVAEIQDLYRRTLAASWMRQPNEVTADECIENIFSGGDGWCTKRGGDALSTAGSDDDDDVNNDPFDDDAFDANQNTLRPGDMRRLSAYHHPNHHHSQQNQLHPNRHQRHQRHHSGGAGQGAHGGSSHRRAHSASSDRSSSTVTGRSGGGGSGALNNSNNSNTTAPKKAVRIARPAAPNDALAPPRLPHQSTTASISSSSSMTSSGGGTRGESSDSSDGDGDARSDDGGTPRRRVRELDEFDLREDLMAWKVPGVPT